MNYLRLESEAISTARVPFPKRIRGTSSFETDVGNVPWILPLSRFNAQLSLQYLRLDAHFIASIRATSAGVSVESYRSEHGVLPDQLPSEFADPFTGRPLRYKKLAKGYVVYSVGEDGRDDGGDEKKDITFTVER